jgi:hypothetical protein
MVSNGNVSSTTPVASRALTGRWSQLSILSGRPLQEKQRADNAVRVHLSAENRRSNRRSAEGQLEYSVIHRLPHICDDRPPVLTVEVCVKMLDLASPLRVSRRRPRSLSVLQNITVFKLHHMRKRARAITAS